MRRTRSLASPMRTTGAENRTVLGTAQRLVDQIQALIAEMTDLRTDNEALRAEVHDAVALLERASGALGGTSGNGRRARALAGETTRSVRPRRAAARRKPAGGRVTPASVTPAVIRAAIAKLGVASAAEIAAEISKHAGTHINGRAVRFLAEQAGAQIETVDGQRKYRL